MRSRISRNDRSKKSAVKVEIGRVGHTQNPIKMVYEYPQGGLEVITKKKKSLTLLVKRSC